MLSKKRQIYNKIVEYFFYFYLFLLPWQTRYIIKQGYLNGPSEYGTYSLYAIDLAFILLFIFSWFYKKNQTNGTDRTMFCPNINLILFSLLLIISFFSIYWAENQELGLYCWLRFLGMAVFLFLLSRININFKKLSWALILAGFLQAALGIWQFFSQKVIASKWLGISEHRPEILGDQVIETSTERFLRAYGALPHPNILGGFLVLCLILLIFAILQNTNKKQNIFLAIILPIITCGLFFSFSRSAFCALFISLLFIYLFLHYQHKILLIKFYKIAGVLFFLFLLLASIYPNLIISRVTQINRLENKSLDERAQQYQESLGIIKQNWPTGIGLGNYTSTIYRDLTSDLNFYEYQPVHNIYLLLFAEIGCFGLVIYILIIINAIKNINFKALSSVTSIIIIIAWLIIGFFDHYLLTLNFGLIIFFLPIGLLAKNCG